MALLQFGKSILEVLENNKKRPTVIASVLDCLHLLLISPLTKPFLIENVEIIALKTLYLYLSSNDISVDDKERVIQ